MWYSRCDMLEKGWAENFVARLGGELAARKGSSLPGVAVCATDGRAAQKRRVAQTRRGRVPAI